MSESQSIENGNGFKVIRLAASNVKALKAVDITPDPKAPLVVIGGNNGQGKTSVLDAIMYALGGKDAVCADPIRHGQKKASVKVDIGKYTVTRRFSPAGQTLEVKTKEGLNVPSPQGALDSILGSLTFDPLAFSRMAPAKRLATLISLVKLDIDLSDLANKRKALYDSRTEANRRRDDYRGELRQTPEPDASLQKEKIDVSALVAEKSRLSDIIASNAETREAVNTKIEAAKAAIEKLQGLNEKVRELRDALVEAQAAYEAQEPITEGVVYEAETAKDNIASLVDPSTESIDAQISDAADLNTKIDRANQYRERQARLVTLERAAEQLTEQLDALDQEKEDALSRAEFPIPGLCFADGDVSFNGTLFDQLSSAEQVKVSLAMAMAMNPALRVIQIRDGSLLDETSLGIVREMASEKGYQVWIEVVGNRDDATIIIEDGAVVGAEEVAEPELANA